MSELTVFWLIVLILSIVIEAITMGLTSIWFAGGALVALLLSAFNVPVWIQVMVFFVVSVVLICFTRPIAVKYFNKDRVRTNVESLIGRQAIVISEIDNLQGIGQVTVGGKQWSARNAKEDKVIPVGAVVRVSAIKGVKLMVEEELITNRQ
ncbi:MAG: NfeD family protein [Lachnospiraceae bacterium]|nr:NfeD family protein [Lachnospiraceae bacterium]